MNDILAEKKQLEIEDFGAQLAKKKTSKDSVDDVLSDVCTLPAETGLCRAAMPRYSGQEKNWMFKERLLGSVS